MTKMTTVAISGMVSVTLRRWWRNVSVICRRKSCNASGYLHHPRRQRANHSRQETK